MTSRSIYSLPECCLRWRHTELPDYVNWIKWRHFCTRCGIPGRGLWEQRQLRYSRINDFELF